MGISKSKYTGYVWMSDEPRPDVLINREYQNDLVERANPFVIEAQLYDEDNHRSISVKYVDGEYLVNTYENVFEGMTLPQAQIELKEFIGNKMDGRILRFLQFWREVPDERCCGMAVLQPKDLVFIGFKKC